MTGQIINDASPNKSRSVYQTSACLTTIETETRKNCCDYFSTRGHVTGVASSNVTTRVSMTLCG